MFPVAQVTRDIIGAFTALPLSQSLAWSGHIALNFRSILKSRNFHVADNKMSGTVTFKWRHRRFSFDLSNAHNGVFTLLREIFIRDIYFRAFDMEKMKIERAADFGCNQGFVSYFLKEIGTENVKILAIDAADYGRVATRVNFARNPEITFRQSLICSGDTDGASRHHINEYITRQTANAFTVDKTMTGHDVVSFFDGKNIDFLKMDIEGSEFDVLINNNDWLSHVDNIAMEVHKDAGNPKEIADALIAKGFSVSHQGGHHITVPIENADYIYASRTGMLRNAQ